MSKFAHQRVLDNGLNYVKANCDKMALISSYTVGKSYASVAGKILAEVTMTSADFTLGSSGSTHTLIGADAAQANINSTEVHHRYSYFVRPCVICTETA